MPPTAPAPRMSKRAFLLGAATGGVAVEAGRRVLPAALGYAAPQLPPHQPSFSQCGEDLIVWYIFNELGVEKPTFIDIGAYHPYTINNTYLMYTRGCRGVLVEPNVDMTAVLKKERPEDKTLAIGIGLSATTEADYYRMNEPSWNTFDKDMADHYVKVSGGEKKILEVVKVPLVNVNEVIAKHHGGKTPDYFSVDVEGLELDILKSLDWAKHRPKVVCVETLVAGTRRQKLETVTFLTEKGYVVRGSSFVNTILVDGKQLG